MKFKLMTLLVCLAVFTSCEPEQEEPTKYEDVCGVIQKHIVGSDPQGYSLYWLKIDGKQYPVNYETFYNSTDGTKICLTDE